MRRQNQSCDQCRRAKRRCVLSVSNDNHLQSKRCTNCARLGDECTFKFVNLQIAKKQKPAHFHVPKHHRWKPPATAVTFRDQLDNNQRATSKENAATSSLNVESCVSNEQLDKPGEDWLTCGIFYPSSGVGLDTPTNTDNNLADSRTSNVQHRSAKASASGLQRKSQLPLSILTSLTLSNPVQQLNASVTALTFNRILTGLYHKIQDGASSRFLTHGCDSVSGITLQGLRDNDLVDSPNANLNLDAEQPECGIIQSTAVTSDGQVHLSVHSSAKKHHPFRPSRVISDNQNQKVTMIGLVHFLDRFGEIYQTKPSLGSPEESVRLLNTVIQAFSMQWLPVPKSSAAQSELESFHNESFGIQPSSSPQTDAYTRAWLHARRCLRETKSRQTFSFIYAAYLFDMTVKPAQLPQDMANTCNAHEFLDEALDHLFVLQRAARQLCEILGNDSNYAKIISSAVSVMERFGYIRDTVSAFINERSCRVTHWTGHYQSKIFLSH